MYNFAAFSTCPTEMESFIKERYPNFSLGYNIDFRQQIADNWPSTIDANRAERHWGMKIDYDFNKTMQTMLEDIQAMYKQKS